MAADSITTSYFLWDHNSWELEYCCKTFRMSATSLPAILAEAELVGNRFHSYYNSTYPIRKPYTKTNTYRD